MSSAQTPFERCLAFYDEAERLMDTLASSLKRGGRDPSFEELKVQIACYKRLSELSYALTAAECDILRKLPIDMQKRLQERALRLNELDDQIDKLETQLSPFGP